jgi:phage terminase small subunit
MIAYPGSNAKNASEAGCKLLKMSKISQYLDNTKEDYETICGVSKARQVREYSKIAYSRISNLHNSWISLKDWDELLEEDPTCMDAVESIDRKLIKRMDDFQNLIEVEYVKIKLHNKIAALQSIDNLMGYKQAEKIDMSSKVTSSVDVTNYTDEEKKVLLKLARKQEYKD